MMQSTTTITLEEDWHIGLAKRGSWVHELIDEGTNSCDRRVPIRDCGSRAGSRAGRQASCIATCTNDHDVDI